MPEPIEVDELEAKFWEDHALLGEPSVRAIHEVHINLEYFNKFESEIEISNMKTDSCPEIYMSSGSEPYEFIYEEAVKQRFMIIRDLFQSLEELKNTLKVDCNISTK